MASREEKPFKRKSSPKRVGGGVPKGEAV